MESVELRFAGHGGDEVSAHRVQPAARPSEPLPAVLLVHDVFGVDAWMHVQAERLAAEGFVCLLPDLWTREGLPGPAPTAGDPAPEWSPEQRRVAEDGLPDRRALGDLDAALRVLGAHPEVERERVAVMGFGLGGNLAFQLACTSREPLALVVDYGGRVVVSEQSSAHPVQPLELALNLACPLLAHFGALDPTTPPEHRNLLEQRLHMFSRECELVVHESVGRGFQNDQRPGYHESAASSAWALTLARLRTHTAEN